MTVDETKLAYLSSWDIDQLIATSEVSVSTGDNSLYTIADASLPNVYEVQFKPTGSTYYYQTGLSSSNGTLAGEFTVYAYILGTSLHVNVPSNGTARYFVWSDKINY